MNICYQYFNNNEPFSYDREIITFVENDKQNNMLTFSADNMRGLICIINRVFYFASTCKDELFYSIYNYCDSRTHSIPNEWCSSLIIAVKSKKIKMDKYTDDSFVVIRPIYLFIRCSNKYFKIVIRYNDYSFFKTFIEKMFSVDDCVFELNYSFPLSTIHKDGSITLHEDVVYNGGGFKVFLKKCSEYTHNRPHVQCLMDGKQYNLSIDDKIEYLNKNQKNDKNANFLEKLINNRDILQKARLLWNQIPSNYKFVEDESGFLVPPPKNG